MIWLNARTHFSLGESVVKIDELVDKAAAAGVTTIGLMDTMNVSGMIDFAKRCQDAKIKPVIGVRLRVVDDPRYRKPALGERKKDNREYYPNVYIRNEEGWRAVLRLLSKGLSEEYFYYRPRIGLDDLLEELTHDGLLVTSGDFNGVFTHPNGAAIWDRIGLNAGGRAYGELVPMPTPFWNRYNAEVAKSGSPTIVTWPILYLDARDAEARDVAAAIIANHKITDKFRNIPWTRCHEPPTEDQLAKARAALDPSLLSSDVPLQALVDQIEYSWTKLPITLPNIAKGETEFEMLMRLCKEGWKTRFGQEVLGYKPTTTDLAMYQERLKYELGVIRKMGFERYFLVVADVVNWAKQNGILVGPGRGSVGGSLVAYLMRITDVDPIRFNLLFERFINPERLDLPDADLDFQSSRREEVISYLVSTYGREKVAGISNFSTMASASALRDVGRVYEVEPRYLEVTKLVPKEHGKPYELNRAADEVPQIDGFRTSHPMVWDIATRLEGVMRSFGRHAAGVVVAGEDLSSRAVVETHRGEPVVNWDKVFVEDLGLVKMDVLGLSTLDVIGLALQYIKERTGESIDLSALPLTDAATLESFAQGETIGVFQFESSGMRNLLKDLGHGGALTFEDLAAATSLYRPGPKDSGLLEDYVAIRQGLKRPYYEHPSLKEVLADTSGVVVYQEQTMAMSRTLAGFSPAEADGLRKAIGKKKPEEMAKYRQRFIDGAMKGNVKVEHEDGREEVMHYSEAVRRGYLTEEA
jgi:DNA polymerase-3 subunit alpha